MQAILLYDLLIIGPSSILSIYAGPGEWHEVKTLIWQLFGDQKMCTHMCQNNSQACACGRN